MTFVCEDQKYLPPYSGWLQTVHILAIVELITLICQIYLKMTTLLGALFVYKYSERSMSLRFL